MHNGRPLPPSAAGQTLASLGIANGDILMLLQASPAPQQQQGQGQGQQAAANPHMALAEDGSARAPAAFIQSAKASAQLMAQLASTQPALAEAIRNEDIEALQVRGMLHCWKWLCCWLPFCCISGWLWSSYAEQLCGVSLPCGLCFGMLATCPPGCSSQQQPRGPPRRVVLSAASFTKNPSSKQHQQQLFVCASTVYYRAPAAAGAA